MEYQQTASYINDVIRYSNLTYNENSKASKPFGDRDSEPEEVSFDMIEKRKLTSLERLLKWS